VVEIGAGLGSLTVALADAGADRVLAIEFDRALLPALRDVVAERAVVEVLEADATKIVWPSVLHGAPWICCGNLPYNVGTSIVLDLLEQARMVDRLVVMVQREVADRLTALPGDEAYGPTTLRVAYRAAAEVVRRAPASVFWPRPAVASAIVRMTRHGHRPVDVPEQELFRLIDGSFAQRRKTMRGALRRLGVDDAEAVLARAGVASTARPETLSLDVFAAVAAAIPA
jgi:16S rRNA (adenine1518-N6/adenine1519-N6)-dimethyltransferase